MSCKHYTLLTDYKLASLLHSILCYYDTSGGSEFIQHHGYRNVDCTCVTTNVFPLAKNWAIPC